MTTAQSELPGYGHYDFLDQIGALDRATEVLDAAIEQEASYSTGDGTLVNDVFGAALYVQTNLESQLFGVMPKIDRSTETIPEQPLPLTFRAAHSPPPLQTHSEGGAVPDGRTYETEEVSAEIKRSDAVVEQSDLQQLRAELLNGVAFDELTRVDELYQDLAIAREGLGEVIESGDPAYSSRDKLTPLDRVIASSDEAANANDPNGNPYNGDEFDVYDIDRQAETWADAFVDFNAAGGRQLTEDLMDSFLTDLFDFGDLERENAVIVTGRRTADVLQDLDDNVARFSFDPSAGGREAFNDADTIPGVGGTTRRREYKGAPIVNSQHVPSHQGDLASIYVLPMDEISIGGESVPRIGIEEYAAPYTEMAGRGETQGFLSTGEYKNQMLYKMDHEVVARDFSSTGKLRDISE